MSDHITSVNRRPSYRRTRAIFLRGMGVVYLAAFWSLAVQVDGLIGSRGIAPVGEFLDRARLVLGGDRYWQVPTAALARLVGPGPARPLLGRRRAQRAC